MPKPLSFCPNGGVIVGADYTTIPTDPSEASSSLSVGCNRLYCLDCKVAVRQMPHIYYNGLNGYTIREIYETEDWQTLTDIFQFKPKLFTTYKDDIKFRGRFYACCCQIYIEQSSHYLDTPWDDAMSWDPILPWRCSGHN